MRAVALLLAATSLSACVASRSRGEARLEQSAQGFEAMRSLAGQWSGTAVSGEESWPVTVTYRITSAGSAVLEDMYAGSDQEMISLYHMDGARLRMTHYCTAGNQPSMVLASSSGAPEPTLYFEFDRGTNMAWSDGHMQSVRFSFVGPDHLIATWAYFEDGKLGHVTHFDLTRATAASQAAASR
jgi:hypothetical protein